MPANDANYGGFPDVEQNRVISWHGPQTPYRFKGNSRLPFAGVGVAERGWVGTNGPLSGAGQFMTLPGWGGFAVKRDIHPCAPAVLTVPGLTQAVPVEGLTGGIQVQGQLALRGLQQWSQSNPGQGLAWNGQGPNPGQGPFGGG